MVTGVVRPWSMTSQPTAPMSGRFRYRLLSPCVSTWQDWRRGTTRCGLRSTGNSTNRGFPHGGLPPMQARTRRTRRFRLVSDSSKNHQSHKRMAGLRWTVPHIDLMRSVLLSRSQRTD